MWNLLVIGFVFIFTKKSVATEDFPSLISANISLAIILDREFLGPQYAPTLETIKDFMKELTREKLKNGGVNVYYYSWSTITLKSEISVVLSVTSCSATKQLLSTTRAQRIALLSITDSDCARLPPPGVMGIPLLDPGQELPQLILDMRIAKVFNWKSAVVVHDDTLSRDMISRVVSAMTVETDDTTVSAIAVSVFKMKHEVNEDLRKQEISKTFSKLNTRNTGENYCVIVTTDVMSSVMEVAKTLNMVHPKSQWMYFVSDTDSRHDNISTFSEMMGEGDNIAILYNVTNDGGSCQKGLICHCKELLRGFVLALDKAIADEREVAAQVSDEEWEAIRPNKFDRSVSIVEQVKKYLSKNSVCDNCVSWKIRAADTWGTSFQRRNSTLPKVDLLQVGFWRPVDGLNLIDKLFPHIAHGFRGRQLPILAFHNPPWAVLAYNESGFVTGHTGLVFDIVDELANNLNFTYYIVSSSFMKDGNDSSDSYLGKGADLLLKSSQNDVFRIIERKGILLAASAFTITEERKLRVNFSMPISTQPYAFLVSRPRELSRALLFMSPFAFNTWVCLALSLVLMGPALYAVHCLSPFYDKTSKKRGALSNLHHCIWYMYGALLQQGGMFLPEADSGRLIVGTWWLVVLVMVTTYSGNLVAFLTFPRQEAPITTVRELLEHSSAITWSLRPNSYLEDFLKGTDLEKYKQLYSGAIMNPGNYTPDIIQAVKTGRHAIIDWKINLQYIMKKEFLETDTCDFALSTEEFVEEQMGLIFAKNSPYLMMVNDEIRRMHQVGLIQRWLNEYLPKRDRCWNVGKTAEVNNHTVNLDDMQGCFFVLFLGFCSSLLILILECLCRKRKKIIERTAIKPFTN